MKNMTKNTLPLKILIALSWSVFFLAQNLQALPITELSCRAVLSTPTSNRPSISWVEKTLSAKNISEVDHVRFNRLNNEANGDLFLQNLTPGGAHIGVGGDFNYTVAGLNQSSQLVIYDIDPNVIFMHQILRAGILVSSTPAELISNLQKIEDNNVETSLQNNFQNQFPKEIQLEKIKAFMQAGKMADYLKDVAARTDSTGQLYTYLGKTDSFNHIRNLFQNDQVRFGLSNQFIPTGFKSAIQDLILAPIHTVYVSNTLEYRWMTLAGGGGMEPGRTMLRGMLTSPGQILGVIQYLELQLKTGRSEDTSSVSTLSYTIADINDSTKPWNYFWQNMRSLPLSPDVIIMSTSRETPLFEPIFKKYGVQQTQEPGFNWYYAQIKKVDFENPDFLNAPAAFAQKVAAAFKNLLITAHIQEDKMISAEQISAQSKMYQRLIRKDKVGDSIK